ncbi:hypothetical protein [Microvirga sp. VF16]|uniref:hypothetical protein n=1 Tax=Microvirga sp. VF16 TaxID=2807101 RepID=UPI00193E6FA8|nr:hypothetical protein [Microvirga sp. VF16]QRM28238.1 hypothetical protein JO965_18615 [Microvirga sp. VF16]
MAFAASFWGALSTESNRRAFAPAFIDQLIIYGLPALLAGLCLSVVITSGRRRLFWALGIIPGSPILLLMLAFAGLVSGAPSEVNRAQLEDGRLLMLGIESIPTDVVYRLWQAEDRYGLVWRKLSDIQLTYSEDGSWTDDPALIATPDGKRVLIRRGGIWTDCLEATQEFKQCPGVHGALDWTRPTEWLQQSEQIASITGLLPGPIEK